MNEKHNFTLGDSASGAHRKLNFIDLFSGCGGFSFGLERAGLTCRAAIDFDKSAMDTFRINHPHVQHVLCRDLKKFSPRQLDRLLQNERIDVIVGGPPCQGFSHARQVDGANHGDRLVHDPRRELYKEFLRYVKYYQPRVFVMENVPGLRTAAGGNFFTRVQVESRELGYRIIPYEVEAWRFGVPQKRVRQLIIGTRRELPMFIPERHIQQTHAPVKACTDESTQLDPVVTLGEAIGDLPPIDSGDERGNREYDILVRQKHLDQYGPRYICDVLQVGAAVTLTAHTARPHNERDLRDFARLQEGENSRQAIARGEQMEFPYDRDNFKDRFTRQHRDELCSTIVAHLKKDGLMFIHPTQLRSLTPREAARVQSFPDTFILPSSRTAAFSQVGNAVPPLVGKAVGMAISRYLESAADIGQAVSPVALPKGRASAIRQIEGFVESLYMRPITGLSKQEFIAAWWAIGYLHPNLHPDAALENGKELSPGPRRGVSFVLEPVYVRSGWPVELIPIALEARRRYDAKELSEDEYYCSTAVIAGALTKRASSDRTLPADRNA